jgi:hypothetical protein
MEHASGSSRECVYAERFGKTRNALKENMSSAQQGDSKFEKHVILTDNDFLDFAEDFLELRLMRLRYRAYAFYLNL